MGKEREVIGQGEGGRGRGGEGRGKAEGGRGGTGYLPHNCLQTLAALSHCIVCWL